jgi:glutathione S-transferase
MKLYQFPFSPNCQKVVALAHEVGTPLELATVDLFKGEARTPAMLAKNPNGKLPILEDGDFVLWESRAMLAYLAAKAGRADLAPTTPRERAEVDRWTSSGAPRPPSFFTTSPRRSARWRSSAS